MIMPEYMTVKEIANVVHADEYTVRRHIKQCGITLAKGKESRLTKEQAFQVVESFIPEEQKDIINMLIMSKNNLGTDAQADSGHITTEGMAVAKWLKITLSLLGIGTLKGCETSVVKIIDTLGLTTATLDDEEQVRAIVDCKRICLDHKMKTFNFRKRR